MMKPITLAILGGGGRGGLVADWVQRNTHAASVVAIAEPDPQRRRKIAEQHHLSADQQFESWEQLLARPRLADAVCNMLMDRLHLPAAIQALERGYHMLLEKPMATTLADCQAIEAAYRRSGKVVSICHSMRYSPVYSQIKQLVDSGVIGQIVSFDQLEGVDPRHQSHSFVRGNWGNVERSAFMLLTKSCHDVDILAWLVGKPCQQVSSFGSLSYFRVENCPPGAPARCTDGCPHEAECIYSALKLYANPSPRDWYAWHAGFANQPQAQVIQALKTSPYGRCVWRCDNDVVDHQVIAFQFEGGVTGTFTMTAFASGGRYLRLHGTLGMIRMEGDKNQIEVTRWSDYARSQMTIPFGEGGHGGLDDILISNFVQAVQAGDPKAVLTSPTESLATHRIAFAAEQSRREGRTIEL